MPPAYDLILLRQGQLTNETVQVADAAEARRLGRELHPECIRGVVFRDDQEAQPTNRGYSNSTNVRLKWSCAFSRAR